MLSRLLESFLDWVADRFVFKFRGLIFTVFFNIKSLNKKKLKVCALYSKANTNKNNPKTPTPIPQMASRAAPKVLRPCFFYAHGTCKSSPCKFDHVLMDCRDGANCQNKVKCAYMHLGDHKPGSKPQAPSRSQPNERKSHDKRSQHGAPKKHHEPSIKQLGSAKIQRFDSNVKAFCAVAFTGTEQEQQESLKLLMKEKASIRGQLTALLELLEVSEKKLDRVIEMSETLKSISKEAVTPSNEEDDDEGSDSEDPVFEQNSQNWADQTDEQPCS